MGSVNVEVKRLQYVYEDKDRHGNVRLYFWRGKGHPKFRIRERIGSPAFYDRYAALRNGQSNSKRDKPHPPHQTKTATFRWLCLRFYRVLPTALASTHVPNTLPGASLSPVVQNLLRLVTRIPLLTFP